MISATDKLRLKPWVAVEQKVQFSEQPICEGPMAGVDVEPWRERPPRRVLYTEADLHVRHFTLDTSRKQLPRAARTIAAA